MIIVYPVLVGRRGVLLLWLHLTAIGLETLGGLWAGVGAMIEDAMNTIVEGLDQLRRLALKMIDDLIDTSLPCQVRSNASSDPNRWMK